MHNNLKLSSSNLLQNIKRLSSHGQLDDAIHLAKTCTEHRIPVPESILYGLIQASIFSKNVRAARNIESLVVNNGFGNNYFLGCHLVRMYSMLGSLSKANETFDRLPKSDVYIWTAIISAHVKFGFISDALKLYNEMLQRDVKPGDYAFNVILQACSADGLFIDGLIVNSHIVEDGFDCDPYIGNTLINMYFKCESPDDGHNVFCRLPKRNIVAWSSIISGYADGGNVQAAFWFLQKMLQEGPKPNNVTILSMLKICSTSCDFCRGKLIHCLIVETYMDMETFIANTLIDMYGKCGSVNDADNVFSRLHNRTTVTWTVMLSSYADCGYSDSVVQCFQRLYLEGSKPDAACFAGVLKFCAHKEMLHHGKKIHMLILQNTLKLDGFIGSSLITMYFKCLCPEDAWTVFHSLSQKTVVCWNAVIEGFLYIGIFEKAFHVFLHMKEENVAPDDVTYSTIVRTCSDVGGLMDGDLIFADVIENRRELNTVVGNNLILMYMKQGCLENAFRIFQRVTAKDKVTWSIIISGYVDHGDGHTALQLYCDMQTLGVHPDNVAFLSIIKACAIISALEQGMLVHVQITENGYDSDVPVENSLIDMYAKCGSLQDASNVFDKMHQKTITSWNAMLSGFYHHDKYQLVLKVFEEMQEKGFKPDCATFVSLLSACNQLGLVQGGCDHFKALVHDFQIIPKIDHYACIIDLLGRAGSISDAASIAATCPFRPGFVACTSLLSHTKSYGYSDLGLQYFCTLVKLDSHHSSGNSIMPNYCVA